MRLDHLLSKEIFLCRDFWLVSLAFGWRLACWVERWLVLLLSFLRVVCVVGGLWWVRCWVLRGRPLVCGWFLVGMLVLWALFVWVCGVGVCGF